MTHEPATINAVRCSEFNALAEDEPGKLRLSDLSSGFM
jgi:hypothetical protein